MAEFAGSDAESLRGKVVLVNFWTYTCINWRRQLPYVQAWADKYKDQGLVVIGVHAPEFEFEKNIANVRWAVNDMKIDYPVAVDNSHAIWRAFDNQAWPALYFIDAQGRLRHHHFGEGSYEQSEMVIQTLLREAGATDVSREPVSVNARGADAAADWPNLKSPENYLGSGRTENFASPGGAAVGKPRVYEAPARLRLNQWALSGDWTVRTDAAVAEQGRWKHHVPLSRPRCSSRHGPGSTGNIREISRADRRRSLQARPTESTSTSKATERSPSSGCTS